MQRNRWLFLLAVCCLFAACGGGDDDGGNSSNPSEKTLHGQVVYRALGCAHDAESSMEGKTVIVKDGGGATIGTDTTENGSCSKTGSYSSKITAEYTMEVPVVDFYEVSIEGVEGSVTQSYDELAGNSFVLDLDAGTSY